MKINIDGLDKADVLLALYNNAKFKSGGPSYVSVFSVLADGLPEGNLETARKYIILSEANRYKVDYVDLGAAPRPLKVDLSKSEFDSFLYDREHGPGSAEKAITCLKEKAKEKARLLDYFAHKRIGCSADEFLTKHPSKLAESLTPNNIHELIKETDNTEFIKKFPNYACLIKTRLEKLEPFVQKRLACLGLADKLNIISRDKKVALNCDLQRKILNYLPTSDIRKVLRASLPCSVEPDSVLSGSIQKSAPMLN